MAELVLQNDTLRLTFDRGRITEIADWPPNEHDSHASFPDLTFTHLLFGHHSLDEMRESFVDVTLNERISTTSSGHRLAMQQHSLQPPNGLRSNWWTIW